MDDPSHLVSIGRWLAHPEYDALQQTGRVATCQEYWDAVATILIAAHEYDHARKAWKATRGAVTYSGTTAGDRVARDDASPSVAHCFEEFAAKNQLVCPRCKQQLTYSSHQYPEEGEEVCVSYRCHSGHSFDVAVSEEEFVSFLKGSEQ